MTPTITADDAQVALALACLPGVGPVTIRRLLLEHGGASAAFSAAAADPKVAADALATASRLRERCAQRGISIHSPGEAQYPAGLMDLEDPPPVLYSLGDMALVTKPAVALVGPRRGSDYGRAVARDFARRLAARDVCVVSGLAMGIDAEAHAATLDANGPTIAVQGTGVDVAYPRSNSALHQRIVQRGLVVSELPPGRAAHPGAFPRRNRLIAALADVVVVIEAGVRSGALITAQLGESLARLVAAVPGAIDRDSSVGSNRLLRDGAHVVASADDVLALLALTQRARQRKETASLALDAASASEYDGDGPGEGSGAELSAGSGAETSTGPGERPGERPGEQPSRRRGDLPGEGRGQRRSRGPVRDLTAANGHAPDSSEGRILSLLAFGPQGPDELVRSCGISPREIGVALSNLALQGTIVIDPSGMARRPGGALRISP